MRIWKIYGGIASAVVTGGAVWVMLPLLWYLGILIAITGTLAVLVGTFIVAAPTYIKLSENRHKQAMDRHIANIQDRMAAIAERPGVSSTWDKNGTWTINASIVDAEPAYQTSVTESSTPRLELPAPRLDECLMLSDDFTPHADDILSQRGMVVGISGSGKSNTVAAIHEELGRLLVPLVLFDTENEYGSLCDSRYLPRGKHVSANGALSVSRENAHEFGRYLIENHLQVVLDLTSYEVDEAAYIMADILAGIQAWEDEYDNSERVSVMITLSESHVWLPQRVSEVQCSKEAYNALQNAFFTDLVRRGRKRGMGLMFDLQRIAEVDKRLMQSTWKILHRQTEENDLNRYEAMGLDAKEVLTLANGEAFVFSSRVSKKRVQIRERRSPHGANTPGLASIQRRRSALEISAKSGEMSEIPPMTKSDFAEPVRLFRPIPEIKEGIPEATKQAILGLYETRNPKTGKPYTRTEIRDEVGLNGDEYWQVKAVCDEHDRERKEA